MGKNLQTLNLSPPWGGNPYLPRGKAVFGSQDCPDEDTDTP